ncbi:MAG TPA: isoprenylcysteine carboxylmethyltransferase family protein [Candidatus Limnocylindria bacterium]
MTNDPVAAVASLARSSPRQTFVLIPLLTLAGELLRGRPRVRTEWLAFCVIGYALYRGAGRYRAAKRAGPPGFARPPDRLLTTGPYAASRNPMYLGHLVFLAGLALATGSPVAVAGLLWQWLRLGARVLEDEERLDRIFGDEYRAYVARVPRWVRMPNVPVS